MKKIILVLFLFLFSFDFSRGAEFKVVQKEKEVVLQGQEIVYLNLFERKDCGYCQDELAFLESLESKDFYLNKIDIADPKNLKLFNQVIEKYGLSASTPLNLIGDSIIVGFDNPQNTGQEILEKIQEAKENKKFNLNIDYYLNSASQKNLSDEAPGCSLSEDQDSCTLPEEPKIQVENKKEVSLFGMTFSIKDMSLLGLSSLLGFIDGFNPCAMWVLLTFLIALSQIGDRRKMAIIAGLFILAEGVMYYFILLFWSSAWKIMPNKELVSLSIGLFAIAAGLYFLYKWWKNRKKFTCDSTGAEQQNKISAKISELSSRPLTIVTVLSVLLLAFSVNVIEVACSLGIPQTFTATLAINELSFWAEQFYISIYTIFYMVDDLIVFALALWGYKKFYQFGAKYSKLSTLFAGVLILILGIMLAFFPTALVF